MLKSGSVEAARVLPRHALDAEATPHVTALEEGALLYLKCFSEELSCPLNTHRPLIRVLLSGFVTMPPMS